MRISLGGLAPSDSSSGLGGITLSPYDFQDFRQHGPRMRVDDLDAPSGEFVTRASLHVASRGANWMFPVTYGTAIPPLLPRLQSLLHLYRRLTMARTPGYTTFSPGFRLHYTTTVNRTQLG